MKPQPHESSSPSEGSLKDLSEEERFGLEDLFRGLFFSVDEIEILDRDAGDCDALVDVSYQQQRSHIDDHSAIPQTVSQTVAYFIRPELKLPTFTAGPMSGLMSGVIRKVLNLVSMPTVKLPDQPEFNKRFLVMSFHRDWTRDLLTPSVVEAISKQGEFTVRTSNGRIAVYQEGHTVPSSERESFLAAASEIADRVIESAERLPAPAMTSGEQSMQTIRTMGGLMGILLRGQIVSTQDVNQFLEQSPPRVAPAGIRKWAYGSTGFLMLWSSGFMLLGSFFVSLMLIVDLETEGGGEVPGWLPYLLMLVPAAGALILFLAIRYRWHRRRILRHGLCEPARVVNVESSGVYSGNEQKHDVTCKTASQQVSVRVGSGPASLARKIQERGESIRLLVDPQDESRALWVEGWAMDAYE